MRFILLLAIPLLVADAVWPAEGLARSGTIAGPVRSRTATQAAPSATHAHAHAQHHAKKKKRRLTGLASFYGRESRNHITASGERFDPSGFTAAHRWLPFGTRVRVINLDNGRHVVVRINDRGPYAVGRIVDVSPAAARALGIVHVGVAHVRLVVLKGRPERREHMALGGG